MFSKGLRKLRYLGEKIASGASYIGHKAGNFLMGASPVLAAINPELGAAAAGVGGVMKGVGKLGDIGKVALGGSGIRAQDVQNVRSTLGNMRSDAQAVKSAYNSVRGPGNPLERRR